MELADHALREALFPEGKPIAEMAYARAKAHRQVPKAIRVALDRRADQIGAGVIAAAFCHRRGAAHQRRHERVLANVRMSPRRIR